MKYLIYSIFLTSIGFQLSAQTTFTTIISTSFDDINGEPIIYNNNYYLPIASLEYPANNYHGYVYKINETGQITDTAQLLNTYYSVYPAVIVPSDNNSLMVFCFFRQNEDSLLYNLAVVHTDENLNYLKHDEYLMNISDVVRPSVLHINDSLFLLTKSAMHGVNQWYDVFMFTFTYSGILVSTKWQGYPISVFNFGGERVPNTYHYKFAFWGGVGGPRLGVIATTDSSFNIIKTDTIIQGMNLGYNLKFINDTIFILSGKKDPQFNPHRDDDYWIITLDTSNHLYNSLITGTYDTMDYPAINNIAFQTPEKIFGGFTKNSIYLMGEFSSWFGLVCFDKTLQLQWKKYYGDNSNWFLYDILATSDGGCLLAGTRYDWTTQYNERDAILIKVDENGLITATGPGPNIQARDAIVYPNPGREKLTIESGPQIAGAKFVLYDMAGKTLIEKTLNHTTETLPTAHLPSGLYLWNITHKGKAVESGKWVKE